MAEQKEDYTIVNAKPLHYGNEWYKHPKVLAEKVLKCNVSTCSITIPNIKSHDASNGSTTCVTTTLPFYIKDDFSFSLSNNWEDACNVGDNALLKLINSTAMIGGQTQISLQSEIMSTKIWKGSTMEPFTLNCLFVSTNRKVNPLDAVKLLAATCLPSPVIQGDPSTSQVLDVTKQFGQKVMDTITGFGKYVVKGAISIANDVNKDNKEQNETTKQQALAGLDAFNNTVNKAIATVGMRAPLEYGVQIDEDENSYKAISPKKNTTVSIRIGNYFRAHELLVQGISGVRISKEVIAPPVNIKKTANSVYDNSAQGTAYGFPLYVECTITLIPFCMVTKDKFNSYITSNSSNTPYTTAQNVFNNAFKLP